MAMVHHIDIDILANRVRSTDEFNITAGVWLSKLAATSTEDDGN